MTANVTFKLKPISEAQERYAKSLFWRYCQLKLGYDLNWEHNHHKYWHKFLNNKTEQFKIDLKLSDYPWDNIIGRLTSQSASLIINFLKPIIDSYPDFQYKKEVYDTPYTTKLVNLKQPA